MSLPTLADLKLETNIPSTADDDELQAKLDQAVQVVEGIKGPLEPRTVVETHYDLWWSREILLRRPPVVELVSVTERTALSDTFTDVLASEYELGNGGTLRTRNGRRLSGDVTVTYTAGREDLSADIAGAIVLIAAHLWETQRGTAPSALALQDPNGFGDATPTGQGYAIPNRALELLGVQRPSIA